MISSSKQNLTFLNQTPALDNFSKQNLIGSPGDGLYAA
jgi:hypothetical protein